MKAALFDVLASRLVDVMPDLMNAAGGDQESDGEKGVAFLVRMASTGALAKVTSLLNEAIDDVVPQVILGSVSDEALSVDSLPLEDFIVLRSAAFQVNNIGALLAAEKNFFAALFGQATTALETNTSGNATSE